MASFARVLVGIAVLLSACAGSTSSAQSDCEAHGGVYHSERDECFGADPTTSPEPAEPTPSPTADPGAIASEYADHIVSARDELLEVMDAITTENLYLTYSSMLSWAEEELVWLDQQPELDCLDSSHSQYRAALRATEDFAESARDAVAAADLVTLEMLNSQAYELGVGIGSSANDAVGAAINC